MNAPEGGGYDASWEASRMATHTQRMTLKTGGNSDLIDVTQKIEGAVADSGISDGMVVVFVPGSTAAVTAIEFEPGLIADTKEAFERLVPEAIRYAHNHGGESNGHAHVRSSIVGPSMAIPLVEGRMTLGTWQQIVVADFDDRPRNREVVIQVVGD